jgi:hypothetical protein
VAKSENIDPAELEKLGTAIARPSIRKAFEQNPLEALERAGVQVDRVPPETIDVLAELSPWELEVLGRVAQRARQIPGIEQLRDHVGVIIH